MFGLMKGKKAGLLVDEETSITDVRYVVVDTELTGLDEKKDSIVSIGAVRMVGGAIDIGNTFYRLVSPEKKLTAESVVIHEIMPSEVAEKPAIDTVLAEFLEFCGDAVLVGHFASIDLAFLDREMKRVFGRKVANPAVDTFSAYEWLRKRLRAHPCFSPPVRRYKLYDIVKCFGIPVNGAHNAVMDAFITAQLFQRMIPMLVEAGAQDIGDLLKIGVPFEG